MTKIKICGLSRRCDIGFVNRCGPDYAGFVVNVPKSRRSVTPEEARALSALLSPEVMPVGVFVNERAEVVASMLNDGIIFAAQLHGSEDEDYIGDLRRRTGGILIQAFSVASPSDMERAAASPAFVRSRISALSNSAIAPMMWKISRPPGVVVSIA